MQQCRRYLNGPGVAALLLFKRVVGRGRGAVMEGSSPRWEVTMAGWRQEEEWLVLFLFFHGSCSRNISGRFGKRPRLRDGELDQMDGDD